MWFAWGALFLALIFAPQTLSLYTNGGACPVNFQPTSSYLSDKRIADAAGPCGDCAISGGSCTLGFGGAYSCSNTQYLSWNYELCYPAVTNCPSNSNRVLTAELWVTDGMYNWQTTYFGCRCNAGYYYGSSTTTCTAAEVGSYSPGGVMWRTWCPAGQYTSATAQSSCSVCIAPAFNTGTGNNQCYSCNPGYYSPSTSDACAACNNAPVGQYWNTNGGSRIDNCGNQPCTNTAVGQYFNSHGGTNPAGCGRAACTAAAVGSYLSSAGGTSAGGCSSAACTNTDAGKYFTTNGGTSSTGCTNVACTNAVVGKFFSSHGGTNPVGCGNLACTNTNAGMYFTTNGGTSATGCTNAACTNAVVGKYFTSHGGTNSAGCGISACTNTNAGMYFTTNGGTSATGCTNVACTNAIVGKYFSSHGGTNPAGCTNLDCVLAPIGKYTSTHGGTSATGCTYAPCTNALAHQYYTSRGGTNASNCSVASCNNTRTGYYYATGGGTNATSCLLGSCSNKPENSQYLPGALNLNSTCAWACNAGFFRTPQLLCEACPAYTYAPFNTIDSCYSCVRGVDFPLDHYILIDSTQNEACAWQCEPQYTRNGTQLQCIPLLGAVATTTSSSAVPAPSTTTSTSTALAPPITTSTSAALVATTSTSAALIATTSTSAALIATSSAAPVLPLLQNIFAVVIDKDIDNVDVMRKVDLVTKTAKTVARGRVGSWMGAAISPDGTYALTADYQDHKIIKVLLSSPYTASVLAGSTNGNFDAVGTAAQFKLPTAVKISHNGSFALVADFLQYRLRKIDLTTLQVTTLAGSSQGTENVQDGVGTSATFMRIYDIAIAPDDSYALLTDRDGNRIRRVSLNSGQATVTTVAGSTIGAYGIKDDVGTSALLEGPGYISISPDQSMAVFTDYDSNDVIRTLDLATFSVKMVVANFDIASKMLGIDYLPSGTEILTSSFNSLHISAIFVSNWTRAYTIGVGSTFTAANDSVADDPLSPQFNWPYFTTVWRCRRPGFSLFANSLQCGPTPPTTTTTAPPTTSTTTTTTPPTTSTTTAPSTTSTTTTTTKPATTTSAPPLVYFTLAVSSAQTTVLTDAAISGYRTAISILTNIDVSSISIRAVYTTATPTQRRRRLLSLDGSPVTILLEVTILVADWAGAAYVIAIVPTDSFQSSLAALCQLQSLPAASVLTQSVGYANVAPPPTSAAPAPAPPPPPPPPSYISPFSPAARRARPPHPFHNFLLLLCTLLFLQ